MDRDGDRIRAVVMDQGDDFPAMLGRARETLAGAVAAGGNRVAV